MRLPPLFLLLLLLLPGAALPAPPRPPTLVLTGYAQRMADRYTARDGLPAGRVTRVEIDGTTVRAQTESGLGILAGGRWQAAKAGEALPSPFPFVEPAKLPPGAKLLSAARGPDGRVWVVASTGAFRSDGERYVRVTPPTSYLTNQRVINIDAKFSCVTTDGNSVVWLGSDVGVFATDGANWWNPFDRTNGLPYEYVTCLAIAPNSDLWVGTAEGVCRYTAGGTWQYYWGPRWLPNNHVNAIALAADGSAWVATDGGVARLYDTPMTLARKAERYQQITDDRHNRRGFVTGCRLKKPGDVTGGILHEASDNDGLWTAVYVGAESFRYAATRDPSARVAARKSMMAMLDLAKYTGVPGFPARAIIFRGEEVDGYDPDETVRLPGETDKIWFPSPADPKVLCKGDTSSDELDGHYFAWSVYYDLVADEAEKKAIRETVRAVTDNILAHDLTLVGPTGRRTLWGVWAPRFLNEDPLWWEERGLDSLEILTYLKVAEHVCGDARYTAKYRELIEKHHYLLNTVTEKVAELWHEVNHSDDQMAFMMYYSLMQHENDPATRLVLLQSMERSWKIERPEHSPFFNFVYGATTGRPCDVEASVATLQDWPWELVDWESRGTHRHDVQVMNWNGEGRTKIQLTRALPASERRLMRWNGNPYQCDGGDLTGRNEEDGSAWLLPYWMGRYHRFISEDTDPAPRKSPTGAGTITSSTATGWGCCAPAASGRGWTRSATSWGRPGRRAGTGRHCSGSPTWRRTEPARAGWERLGAAPQIAGMRRAFSPSPGLRAQAVSCYPCLEFRIAGLSLDRRREEGFRGPKDSKR
jgi:hypothetical protein